MAAAVFLWRLHFRGGVAVMRCGPGDKRVCPVGARQPPSGEEPGVTQGRTFMFQHINIAGSRMTEDTFYTLSVPESQGGG